MTKIIMVELTEVALMRLIRCIDASIPPHSFIKLKIKKDQEFERDNEPDRMLDV
jgi:hypothetical protein